ncbi:MAG: HdeD family acid-resistance protein [Alphaproteobacteria bacterium]|nr:HdeD family acid-resistance protein [Alphaproteobacteria bacterium]
MTKQEHPLSPQDYLALKRSMGPHWIPFFAEGIVLIILGTLAVVVPGIASIAMSIFLGWILFIGGIVSLIVTLLTRRVAGFWWSLLSAILTIVAGMLFLGWPVAGVFSLVFILTIFLIVDGVLTILFAIDHRKSSPRWGWLLTNGILDLLMAVAIIMAFPASAAWALGLIIGIDMLFGGTALVTLALSARERSKTTTSPRGSF